jgi:hypothetical protein
MIGLGELGVPISAPFPSKGRMSITLPIIGAFGLPMTLSLGPTIS